MIHTFLIAVLGLCLSIVSTASANTPQPIKVACVGNSITYGAGIVNPKQNSYPSQLAAYLGESYEVRNFGISGRTLLEQGDYPYVETEVYRQSLEYQPDVVFIKLGTNDSKPQNIKHFDRFKADFLRLIDSYRKLPSKPRIVVLTPVKCFRPETAGISDSVIRATIRPAVEQIAYEQQLDIVNLYNLFGETWEQHLMPDGIHPSSIGAGRIASKLYEYLTVTEEPGVDIIGEFPLRPVREFSFHGHRSYAYDNNGTTYYIVRPHRVAKGAPWVWRARFWGHEPQTDIELLERGFHLAYCDVADLYGAPKAVARWDEFYKLATAAGLSKKPVLEAMSRGGLIAYNWAAQNPGRVGCIYADAPVLDIKSWPLGEGHSHEAEQSTKQLLAAYGFPSRAAALAWDRNPLDLVNKLAKAHIPILHVVGDADQVVPVAENTDLFAKQMAQRGAHVEIIRKPRVGHHPHSLNDPQPIVDFILRATKQLHNRCTHAVCGNEYRMAAGWTEGAEWHTIAQDIEQTLEGKRLKLLLLGNSITQGFGGTRKLMSGKPGREAMDRALGTDDWESAGISGDRTQHLLWRIRHGNYNRCNPENAVITIGINNVLAGDDAADIAAGIIACAVEARKQLPHTRIFLLGLLPAGVEPTGQVRKACVRIHQILSQTPIKGVEYIDPTPWFETQNGGLKTELYGSDGVHLTTAGYRAWSAQIAALIEESTAPTK